MNLKLVRVRRYDEGWVVIRDYEEEGSREMVELVRRVFIGLVMCLCVHFGQVRWPWDRSIYYGLAIVGGMYIIGEVMEAIKRGRASK